MLRSHHLAAVALLLTAVAFTTACKKNHNAEPAPAPGTGLEGHWRLVDRQCYCPQAPTPNETATFTATDFLFHRNGRSAASGTYACTAGLTFCGGSAPVPVLSLTYTAGGSALQNAAFTLRGDTLVLDYGSPCDAPRDTYQRLP